jgi:hypothetical protein
MDKKPDKKLNKRALVALTALISGIGLPFTGLAVHLLRSNSPHGAGHAWMSTHEALGIIFSVSTIWHIILNRKGLVSHIRHCAGHVAHVSKEFLWATALVGMMLLMALSHSFLAH